MEALDEWRVPEPSSRFDPLLQARLRETEASSSRIWRFRLQLPVISFSLAALLLVGAIAMRHRIYSPTTVSASREFDPNVHAGSAVGDLQSLEEADDLMDFDLLDDFAPDQQFAASQN
jgi:hypothetical protein